MMNLDGSGVVKLASLHMATSVAVEPRAAVQKVFYSVKGREGVYSGQIVACDLSGSNRRIALSQHVFMVNNLHFIQFTISSSNLEHHVSVQLL